jgi:hypothetical protein
MATPYHSPMPFSSAPSWNRPEVISDFVFVLVRACADEARGKPRAVVRLGVTRSHLWVESTIGWTISETDLTNF